jgi:rubrerythrin
MKLKELSRDVICGEMMDISVYTVEAEAFASHPFGKKAAALFLRLAEEKRGRLKELDKMFRDGIGFRQRNISGAKSLEAALRVHVTRAETALRLYADLLKIINKPEYKETFTAILAAERAGLNALRELQAELKAG